MNNSALDSGIPVLTEIISPPLPPSPPAHIATAHAAVVDVPFIDGWLADEWERLERKIGGRILQQVMDSLEAEVKERIRDVLTEALQVAVDALADDIKGNLQRSLEEVVYQAVKDEISNMQTVKR